jgi:hypothetical protein
MDPAQRRLAERRLLDTLRRLHRREPLRSDVRVDRLIAELHSADPARPSGHRGRQPLSLSDVDLRTIVDGMVGAGTLVRHGHRVRLAGRDARLDPEMGLRIDQLLAVLGAAGATPPSAESVAARLGIPAALVDQLRANGDLLQVAPRIDYSPTTWAEISARLDRLAGEAPLSVGLVRDHLHTTRRHAEAILRRRRAVSARSR